MSTAGGLRLSAQHPFHHWRRGSRQLQSPFVERGCHEIARNCIQEITRRNVPRLGSTRENDPAFSSRNLLNDDLSLFPRICRFPLAQREQYLAAARQQLRTMNDFRALRSNQMLRLSPVGRNKQDAMPSKAAARSARSEFGVPGFHKQDAFRRPAQARR